MDAMENDAESRAEAVTNVIRTSFIVFWHRKLAIFFSR
jgi:hypothetical protein